MLLGNLKLSKEKLSFRCLSEMGHFRWKQTLAYKILYNPWHPYSILLTIFSDLILHHACSLDPPYLFHYFFTPYTMSKQKIQHILIYLIQLLSFSLMISIIMQNYTLGINQSPSPAHLFGVFIILLAEFIPLVRLFLRFYQLDFLIHTACLFNT